MAASLVALGVTLPTYTSTSCGHAHSFTASGFENILGDLSDLLINDVWAGNPTLLNEVLKSIKTYEHLFEGLQKGFASLDKIPYESPDIHCLTYMEYNLFEFSRLKVKSDVFAINRLLIDKEKNNINSYQDFYKQAKGYLENPDRHYLRAEYNHAVAVGQNASRYYKFIRELNVTKYLQWKTVGDTHVRQSHQILEGKIFDLSKDKTMAIFPPKDWGCRCELVQYIGEPNENDVTTSEQALADIGLANNPKWNVNRGEIAQVFTANEYYYKASGLKQVFERDLDFLTFDKYKLPALNSIQNLPALKIDNSINPQNVKELFKKEAGTDYMGFTDYLGRKLSLKQSNFKKHTTGIYTKPVQKGTDNKGERHKLFPFVEDVLKNPNEVYLVDYKKRENATDFQANYLKFFTDEKGKNRCILVNTTATSEGCEINTWFELDKESNRRRGYLIHKKS